MKWFKTDDPGHNNNADICFAHQTNVKVFMKNLKMLVFNACKERYEQKCSNFSSVMWSQTMNINIIEHLFVMLYYYRKVPFKCACTAKL